jgi:hypothetical protein
MVPFDLTHYLLCFVSSCRSVRLAAVPVCLLQVARNWRQHQHPPGGSILRAPRAVRISQVVPLHAPANGHTAAAAAAAGGVGRRRVSS